MDPISDMLIRIKNAEMAGRESVRIPYSKFKHEIAKALERAGLIQEIERKGKKVKKFKLKLKNNAAIFRDMKLLSTPGRRLYASYKELVKINRGGLILLTTSRGVMTSEEAIKVKVGGQLIAKI